MNLNEKIAARRRELEAHPSGNFSEPKFDETNVISEKSGNLPDIQDQIVSRRRELAKQENYAQNSEKTHVEKWFEEKGSNIRIEAIKRVSIATYGSMMIWSMLAMELLFNHETFNGPNATMGGLLLFGGVMMFLYSVVTKNEKRLAAKIMSESSISNAGILDNLKATSPTSYIFFGILLFLSLSLSFS